MTFFVTDKPVPVLNTPYFTDVYGQALPFDDQRLVRAVEFIALPGQSFSVRSEAEGSILEVDALHYPYTTPLFIDRRFGLFSNEKLEVFQPSLPPKEEILRDLISKVGLPYIWGGNWSKGMEEWERLYPPPQSLTPEERDHWTFRGLDCSGMLYEATGGFTPRNTSGLFKLGKQVSIDELEPLDVIVYPGHNLVVLSPTEIIESCHELGGVVISPLKERINQIQVPLTARRFL